MLSKPRILSLSPTRLIKQYNMNLLFSSLITENHPDNNKLIKLTFSGDLLSPLYPDNP